jgi:glycosyltransferase involved in cell wall biosynthesis
MKKNQRIAFIVVSLEAGGTENYLLRFLRSKGSDSDITIICKGGKLGSLESEYRTLGVKIECFKLGYLDFKMKFYFKQLLNRDFDVVCDLTGNFAGIAMRLGKLNKIPKRIAFYRASSDHFKPTFFNRLYNNYVKKLVLDNSTHILSNSQSAFDYFFPQKEDNRFQVIKNGIDINSFQSDSSKLELRDKYAIPSNSFVIGHVGRYNAAKNFPTLFKVAQRLVDSKEAHNLCFVFCGRGTDSEDFKTQLKLHGILDHSICLGQQPKVYEVLKCYDLFYFPSVTEGQPNALIEAIISGLPFVASNIDAIKEAVPEIAYSQLVDPTDVDATVDKILAVANQNTPLILKDWAISEYDANRRFDDFKKILVG